MCYKWKENLNTTHRDYVRAEEIPAILTLLDQIKEWLETDGLNATRGAYSEKIDKINAKVLPIKNRFDTLYQIS
jgi:hypothetical protein